MRIAFLTPEYVSEPKFDGGLANYLFRVTRLLREEGHDPEVFVAASKDETIEHEGILVHRCAPSRLLNRLHSVQRRVLRRHWLSYMDVVITEQALARRFTARNRTLPFDVVEASNFKGTGLFVIGSERPALVTRISYSGGCLWDSASGRRADLDCKLRYLLEDLCARRSECVYGPCTRLANVLSGRIKHEIKVIHPPLFRSLEESSEDDSVWRKNLQGIRYVLFFGRICKVKGVDILARAMREVLEGARDLRLVMVGREENKTIMREIHELLGKHVSRLIHLNRLSHAQLFPVIRQAECVVLPSRVENFPNVCVEAMLLGQMVIGTKNTGFEDLIEDGVTGLLACPDDYSDLVYCIRRALHMTHAHKDEIQRKAMQRVMAMHPRKAIHELVQYYQEAIDRKANRHPTLPVRERL